MEVMETSPQAVPSAAASIRFVLVGTQHPGNIGAAARAMKTMGLGRLVLVAPEREPDEDAYRRAAGAEDLIQAAPVHASLAEAVADCTLVLGCTCLLYTSPSPRDGLLSRMPSSA